MQQRAMIFIDGSNFYHSLKKSFGTASIHIEKFCLKLAGENKLEKIFYYTAPVNINEYPLQYASQQKFFKKLNQIQNLRLFLGRLERHDDGQLTEKGVDVKLAIDLLIQAFQDNYDVAFLITNDADFVPAVIEVQKLGKQVIHVTFPKNLSFHLDKFCDATIVISSVDDVLLAANDEHKK